MAFLLELLAEWFAYGWVESYRNSFRCWTESISQLCNLLGMYHFFNHHSKVDLYTTIFYFEVTIFIRILRVLSLLYEIQTIRVIQETIINLIGSFLSLICVQLTIFYAFAAIGVQAFGGLIVSDSAELISDPEIPPGYELCNFNDFGSAFVTLFSLMVVNNWQYTVHMFVQVTNSEWTPTYFIVFYYFSVVIGINIVIAYAIDNYNSIARLEDRQSSHEAKLWELARDVINKKKEQETAALPDILTRGRYTIVSK